jgi:hypothetical protein
MSEGAGQMKVNCDGLSELLAEFYQKANIAQLWDKYQPLIQAENDQFKPFA